MTPQPAPPPLILASASPRRQELLVLAGWGFELQPTSVAEAPETGETAEAMARRLAVAKARAALNGSERTVVAADTVVEHRGEILGKPADEGEAQSMLERLSGDSHRVITAVAIFTPGASGPVLDVCVTEVPMRPYAAEEAAEYVAGGSPMDKAGAYGIQDGEFQPVDIGRLRGCFANVMGMPLCHLARAMRRLGRPAPADVPAACRAHTGYDCPVYESILGEAA